jgi:hypothetical protein
VWCVTGRGMRNALSRVKAVELRLRLDWRRVNERFDKSSNGGKWLEAACASKNSFVHGVACSDSCLCGSSLASFSTLRSQLHVIRLSQLRSARDARPHFPCRATTLCHDISAFSRGARSDMHDSTERASRSPDAIHDSDMQCHEAPVNKSMWG